MAPRPGWQGFDLAHSVGYLLRMVGTAKAPFFTAESARLAGLKSVAVQKARKAQRLAAIESARLETADNALARVNAGKGTIARAQEVRSKQAMELLSVEAVKQAESLAKAPANEPGVFKTIVEACDKLFGWSRDGGPRCLVQIGTLNQLAEPLQSENTTTYRHCGAPAAGVVDITEDKPAETGLSG